MINSLSFLLQNGGCPFKRGIVGKNVLGTFLEGAHLYHLVYKSAPLNLGSSGFSHNQNNHGDLNMKADMHKMPHHVRKIMNALFCVCYSVCGRQNENS